MSSQIKPTLAQITASKSNIEMINKPKYKTYIFLKEDTAAATSKDTKTILTSVELQLLKIKPDRVIKVKNKGVLIESLDPEITKLTNNKDLSRLRLEARLPEKVWPRLIFYNVPSSLPEEEFLTCVLNNINDEMIKDNNWYKKYLKLVHVIKILQIGYSKSILRLEKFLLHVDVHILNRLLVQWRISSVLADVINAKDLDIYRNFVNHKVNVESALQFPIKRMNAVDVNLIGISEMWLEERVSNDLITFDDSYSIVRSARNGRGGGVALFYKNKLSLQIVVIYRPPYSSHNTFVQEFELLYSHLLLISEKIIFLGDFNFDVLSLNKPGIQQYLDMLDSLNIAQIIGKPTRITDKTSTLLDHILTSDIDIIRSSSVEVNHNISDHYVIFCELNLV
ncbi:hypothetical protein ILUMI_17190, partial [Ignelater luminosus]